MGMNREQLIKDRKQVFKTNDFPDFPPSDGICWSCHEDIIPHYGNNWPVAKITGCPICHRSYCD